MFPLASVADGWLLALAATALVAPAHGAAITALALWSTRRIRAGREPLCRRAEADDSAHDVVSAAQSAPIGTEVQRAHAAIAQSAQDMHVMAARMGAEAMHERLAVCAGQDIVRLVDDLRAAAADVCRGDIAAPPPASGHLRARCERIARLLDAAELIEMRARTVADELRCCEESRWGQAESMEEASVAIQVAADHLAILCGAPDAGGASAVDAPFDASSSAAAA